MVQIDRLFWISFSILIASLAFDGVLTADTELFSRTIPFRFPMLLGRSYDINTHTCEEDVLSLSALNNVQVEQSSRMEHEAKFISNNKELMDFMGLDAQLSLKVATGLEMDITGGFKFARETSIQKNEFIYMVKSTFIRKSETIKDFTSNGVETCGDISPQFIGSHFISQINYGGILYSALHFKFENEKQKKLVKAQVGDPSTYVKKGNTFLQLYADVKKNVTASDSNLNMRIVLLSTAAQTRRIPTTIDELEEYVQSFKDMVGQFGTPVQAQIQQIDKIDRCSDTWGGAEDFEVPFETEDRINGVVNMLADVLYSEDVFYDWWETDVDQYNLNKKHFKEVTAFMSQFMTANRLLNKAAAQAYVVDEDHHTVFDKLADISRNGYFDISPVENVLEEDEYTDEQSWFELSDTRAHRYQQEYVKMVRQINKLNQICPEAYEYVKSLDKCIGFISPANRNPAATSNNVCGVGSMSRILYDTNQEEVEKLIDYFNSKNHILSKYYIVDGVRTKSTDTTVTIHDFKTRETVLLKKRKFRNVSSSGTQCVAFNANRGVTMRKTPYFAMQCPSRVTEALCEAPKNK